MAPTVTHFHQGKIFSNKATPYSRVFKHMSPWEPYLFKPPPNTWLSHCKGVQLDIWQLGLRLVEAVSPAWMDRGPEWGECGKHH